MPNDNWLRRYVLVNNLLTLFKPRYLLWHALAIVLTLFLVTFGWDWSYFIATRPLAFEWLWHTAGILGFFVSVLLPLGLYIISRIKNNPRTLTVALLLAQSVVLGWLLSSLYKFFTGRIPPDLQNTILDVSHGFRFGFYEGGIFWGWPSGHATVAFALATTLWFLYPRHKFIKYSG